MTANHELQLAIDALNALMETTNPRGIVREVLSEVHAELIALTVTYDA